MNYGNKRSTIEQIEKMKQLHEEGLSSVEIGRKLGKDHSTILYWIKREKGYVPIKAGRRAEIQEEQQNSDSAQNNQERICQVCKKIISDSKWELTNYCSLKCFGSSLEKII